MSTTFVKVNHAGKSQTIALFDGISTEEIASILKTVFSTSGSIVGFTAENGTVFPLSVVCRSPRSIGTSVCTLVVTKNEKDQLNKLDSVGQNEAASEEEISSEYVMQEIIRFIEGLKDRGFLSKSQERLLLELLLENSTLLFAAYSVAISAQDSEYLAEICKDLVQSLTTAEGRVACEAQDEVLQVCDQLYINDKITENQLLYLRHLVLIRDESVASLYDDFQEHQNVPLLAKALYDLSNTHPYQHTQEAVGEDSDSEEENDDEESHGSGKVSNAALVEGLSGVVALMIRSRVITNSEASILLELVRAQNENVCAAYELFTYDQNLEELQDTLLRCGKLEIRRRAQESRGSVDEPSEQHSKKKTASSSSNASTSPVFDIDKISLEAILASVDVTNMWESVPDAFVRAVFVAVLKQHLTVAQGRALCDLYAADYDLVTAAWEVFTVQEDSVDLVDTLQRIVRDISVDNASEEKEDQQEEDNNDDDDDDDEEDSDYNTDDAEEDEANESEDSQDEDDEEEEEEGEEENGDDSSSDDEQPAVSTPNSAANREVQDRKSQALAAVASAKRDLLRHSLEMMVKQNMTSAESAGELYSRYLGGDLLIAAAIESYANDRDVSDFLDTLQVLANTSPELLQSVMRDIEGDDAKKTEATQRSPNQKATSPQKTSSASPVKATSPAKNSNDIEKTNTASLLSKADQKTVVDILTRASAISPSQTASLSALIDRGDRQVGEIFAQYEADKDVYKLIDTLKALDTHEENDEDSEEEQEEEQQTSSNKHSIESKFLEIVQSMSLSHLETAALRLAIARNDDSIRRAIESFRQNLNEEVLKRSLKGIAVDTISATMNEEDEERNDRHEQQTHKTAASRHEVEEEQQSGNDDDDEQQEEQEDEEDDDEEEEEEEENGTSWITSQTARDHVFPILISELVKENILSAHAGAVVMQQFGAKNPVIGAALDVYDQSNDMAQLVDTLLEVVGTF